MQYFLVENFFRIASGFLIVDKFNTIEEAQEVAAKEHDSERFGKIIWEDFWWDGKTNSNTFNSGTNHLNDWRYEIHRHWEDGD